MNRMSHLEQGLKKQIPAMRVGDTVRVFAKIREGEKERVQVFEGTMIARKRGGSRETITVRKISFGVGVEKIFPVHSPAVEKIDVLRQGRVRKAKLYYLREKKGRAAKVEEGKSQAKVKSAPVGETVSVAMEQPEPAQVKTT